MAMSTILILIKRAWAKLKGYRRPATTVAVAVVAGTQEGIAPGAMQQQALNDLVRQPLMVRQYDGSKRYDPMGNINPDGAGEEVFRIVPNSSVATGPTQTISAAGIVIPPSAEKYHPLTLVPADQLWPREVEQRPVTKAVRTVSKGKISG